MNKKHVTSLEISKLIKEAGWKKETEFWWFEDRRFVKYDSKKWKDEFSKDWGLINFEITDDCYPAPLATEILEELPYRITDHYLTITKDVKNYYNVHYGSKILITGVGLPDASAKMYLYLTQNNLLEKE